MSVPRIYVEKYRGNRAVPILAIDQEGSTDPEFADHRAVVNLYEKEEVLRLAVFLLQTLMEG